MEWLNKLFDKLLSIFPFIYIIGPNERGCRVTLGTRVKPIGPGWYILWSPIQFISSLEVVTQVIDLPPQTVRTKDGQEIVVSGSLRYRISDIENALFAVQDFDKALSTLSLGVILEYIRTRTLDECSDIESVKKELRRGLAQEASGWGVKIEQVYLTDLGRVRSIRLFGDNLKIS